MSRMLEETGDSSTTGVTPGTFAACLIRPPGVESFRIGTSTLVPPSGSRTSPRARKRAGVPST